MYVNNLPNDLRIGPRTVFPNSRYPAATDRLEIKISLRYSRHNGHTFAAEIQHVDEKPGSRFLQESHALSFDPASTKWRWSTDPKRVEEQREHEDLYAGERWMAFRDPAIGRTIVEPSHSACLVQKHD